MLWFQGCEGREGGGYYDQGRLDSCGDQDANVCGWERKEIVSFEVKGRAAKRDGGLPVKFASVKVVISMPVMIAAALALSLEGQFLEVFCKGVREVSWKGC